MNKFVKISIGIFLVVIIISIILYIKLFVVGSISYEDVVINKVTEKNNEIVLDGTITNSSRAFNSFEYTLVDTELYIVIKSTVVSNKHKSGSFNISIPISIKKVNNIHLSNNKETKVIYSKQV